MCNFNLLARLFRRSITAFSVSVILLSGAVVNGAQGFAVGSLDLQLTGPIGWFEWYNPFDSPEGAYLGTVYETLLTQPGTVQLGRTLQPGHYYVAWKVMDYGAGGSLDFNIGGALASTALNQGDYNGQWTVPVAIDVPSQARAFRSRCTAPSPLINAKSFFFGGSTLPRRKARWYMGMIRL
jgi:hypothetical protein